MGKYVAVVRDRLVLPARVSLTHGREQSLRSLGQRPSNPISIRLVIDTGSGRSTLLPSVLAQLSPVRSRTITMATALGTIAADMYWVRLEFPDASLTPIAELAVARAPLPLSVQDCHGVLGRDVLRRWESFLYEGRRGRITIRDTRAGWFGW